MLFVYIIYFLAVAYLACGFVFAIFFITKGVQQVDEGVEGSSTGFRLIILPGTMVFWPLLLKKWVHALKNKSHD